MKFDRHLNDIKQNLVLKPMGAASRVCTYRRNLPNILDWNTFSTVRIFCVIRTMMDSNSLGIAP